MVETYESLWAAKESQADIPETFHLFDLAQAVSGPTAQELRTPADFYQNISTKLIGRDHHPTLKTILVTAAARGDGASLTAVNLATALARDHRSNVLLIDANLRRPSLHNYFDIEAGNTLADLETARNPKPFYSKREGQGNFFVIPAGVRTSGVLALFKSRSFKSLLKTARRRFDFTILDGPSATGAAETGIIGPQVDGAILVITAGKTRRQVVIKAKQDLEEAGTKILGVVLNRRKHYIPAWIYRYL